MFKVGRAIEIIREDGLSKLLTESERYLLNRAKPVTNRYCSWKFSKKHGLGDNVMDEDWDNLVILDACNYEIFSQEQSISGELDWRVSKGRDSWEFMRNTFVGNKYPDTIYVTANPFVSQLDSDIFHAIIDEPLVEQWDEKIGTVRPEDVTEIAIDAHHRFPDKKLIVHYMQPHLPPIGEKAREIRSSVDIDGWDKFYGNEEKSALTQEMNLFDAHLQGFLSEQTVLEAYRESLHIVQESVKNLLEAINGKSVVSADHGELIGQRPSVLSPKMYGHGTDEKGFPRTSELCKVPWLEVDDEHQRRTVTAEEPIQGAEIEQETALEQLEALGYR